MAPDIELLLNLQSLDDRILALKREIAALPKHIAEIETALVGHQRQLEADEAALSGNGKERKKLEGDIRTLEEKVSKLNDQMLQAKTNDQYNAFKHEIEYCREQITKHEDRILDLMAESEPLAENVGKAKDALKAEQQQVDKEKKEAQERSAEDERELAACLAERKKSTEGLKPQLVARYGRLRQKHRGAVVVEGVAGRCSACQISMRPQLFQDLKQATEPLICENCGRLLYFHAPVDVEAENAEPAAQ
jgi:predicted  nucleic acid-binding Zn-ribbon protein